MEVEWYKRNKGTQYEGSRIPRLRHKYIDHDLNRDWWALTQPEVRNVVKMVINVWRPHIVMDMHQMGVYGYINAVTGLLASLMLLGIDNAYARYFFEYKSKIYLILLLIDSAYKSRSISHRSLK